MLVREGNKVSRTQKVCEAGNTQKVYVLVNPKNSSPLLLQNHLWFFDPKLSSNIADFNKSFSDKGLSISQLPVETGEFKGDVLDVVAKDEKNMIVDTAKDFTSLVSFLNKNIQSLVKTKKDVPKDNVQKQVDKAQEPKQKEKSKKGLAFSERMVIDKDIQEYLKKKNMKMIAHNFSTNSDDILFYGLKSIPQKTSWFYYDYDSAEDKYYSLQDKGIVRGGPYKNIFFVVPLDY